MNADALRTRMRKLKRRSASETWNAHCKSLRRHVKNEDPETFLRWSTVRATMYVGSGARVNMEHNMLSDRLKDACTISPFGGPDYYVDDDKRELGANHIHQASQVQDVESALDINIADISKIAEFGAGYGALCSLAHNLGFGGKYYVYDLPEFLLMQEYYLSNVGIRAYFNPGFRRRNVDLLMAFMSLSEAPVKLRDKFLGNIRAKYYAIRFQVQWDGIDNMEYFTGWADENLEDYEIGGTTLSTHKLLTGVAK